MLGPVVCRVDVEDVLGLEYCVCDQLPGVLVRKPVKHSIPLVARRNDPGEPQLGEVLRDRGGWLVDGIGQLVDRQLLVAQGEDDANPSRVSQHREDLNGKLDVPAGR